MKRTILAALLLLLVGPLAAQDLSIESYAMVAAPGQTILVPVYVKGTATATQPLSSFQLIIETSNGLVFQGHDTVHSWSGQTGWTAGSNPDNGRVGGFSSSADAITSDHSLTHLVIKDSLGTGGTIRVHTAMVGPYAVEDLTIVVTTQTTPRVAVVLPPGLAPYGEFVSVLFLFQNTGCSDTPAIKVERWLVRAGSTQEETRHQMGTTWDGVMVRRHQDRSEIAGSSTFFKLDMTCTFEGQVQTFTTTEFIVIAAPSGVATQTDEIPEGYALGAYPNPFNPITTIVMEVPTRTAYTLVLYDAQGRLIRHIASGETSHRFEIQLDVSGLPNGTYYVVAETADFSMTQSVVILK